MWYVGVLCGRSVHCVLGWCTVCYVGVLHVMAVYCVLWRCNAC